MKIFRRISCPDSRPLPLLPALFLALTSFSAQASEAVPKKDLQAFLHTAGTFVRSQQNPDGSFGRVQPRLQTSLALLAILSLNHPPAKSDRELLEKSVLFLVGDRSSSGDLGDDVYRTESHSLALTALLSAFEYLAEGEPKSRCAEAISRGLRHSQRTQDRSSTLPLRGGWKMEGTQGKDNDRRATVWALFAYATANRLGLPIDPKNLERGANYLLASQKVDDAKPDQLGGLSVDAQGLAVESLSAMGGWTLQEIAPDSKKSALNLQWLTQAPLPWSGPNYFYANFFRVRALQTADPTGLVFQSTLRKLYLQLREHQQPDGCVAFPPGEALNLVDMGPVFSTSLAILILNVQESALVIDRDFRIRPLFSENATLSDAMARPRRQVKGRLP